MKKAVITILGMILPPKDGQQPAKYYFSDELKDKFRLKKDRYVNMFPLLLDNFEDYGKIKPIYTQSALERQKQVLESKFENINFDIEKNGIFISENSEDEEAQYSYFLNKYNEVIENYDKVIIDVSHGFRHLPILSTVNLIIQNIKNPDKIEYILFAKEIESFKKYEIIDLKEYLDLANLSFMLSTFNQNYTVSNNIKFKTYPYQELANELSEFSNHFLSNSLKQLIEGDLIDKIIKKLKELKVQDTNIKNFTYYIQEIIIHLEEIKKLKREVEWKKLYELSKIMNERGYLLNAITLLFESVGFYCVNNIENISKNLKGHIEYFKKELIDKKEPKTKYSTYALVNQSRNIVKLTNKFKGDYLYNPDKINLSNSQWKNLTKEKKTEKTRKILAIHKEVENYINSCKNIDSFQDFIISIENLRNNLAHGNSGLSLGNVQNEYNKYLKKFEKFVIENNILN